MLGNGRLEAMCFDGTKRLCHIRGKLRKKVRIDRSIDKAIIVLFTFGMRLELSSPLYHTIYYKLIVTKNNNLKTIGKTMYN